MRAAYVRHLGSRVLKGVLQDSTKADSFCTRRAHYQYSQISYGCSCSYGILPVYIYIDSIYIYVRVFKEGSLATVAEAGPLLTHWVRPLARASHSDRNKTSMEEITFLSSTLVARINTTIGLFPGPTAGSPQWQRPYLPPYDGEEKKNTHRQNVREGCSR